MAVVLDANDFDGDDVVLVDDFSGVVDAAVDELRNVDKAFDGPLQADKGAERCELRDLAGNNLSLAVVRNDFFPALGLGAPDAKRDLLAFVVDLEHINGDVIAYREQLVRRFGSALPGELREVNEAVSAADVDEDPEVADAGHRAGLDVAFLKLEEEAFLLGGALLLDGGALGEDGAVAPAVELDDFEGDGLPDPLRERVLGVLGRGAVGAADELGERDESVDAFDVDEQPAFVAAGDVGLEGLVAVHVVLKDAPAALSASTVEREDDLSLGRLRLDDEDEDFIADAETGRAFGLKAVHFVRRDDAFGLGADVYENRLSIAADDHAFDDLATAEFGVGGLGFEEGGHRVLLPRRALQ